MPEIIVDTSTLIALSHTSLLEFLCNLYNRIIIPYGVLEEFGEISLKCIDIVKVEDKNLVKFLSKYLNLGKGEAEVIALAYKNKWICSIDDLKAKRIAKDMGLMVTGTIGILVKMKEKGLINSVYEQLLKLKEKGFYLSDSILEEFKEK